MARVFVLLFVFVGLFVEEEEEGEEEGTTAWVVVVGG